VDFGLSIGRGAALEEAIIVEVEKSRRMTESQLSFLIIIFILGMIIGYVLYNDN